MISRMFYQLFVPDLLSGYPSDLYLSISVKTSVIPNTFVPTNCVPCPNKFITRLNRLTN